MYLHGWPANYSEARNRFVQTASALGAQLTTHPVPTSAQDSEPLSIDVATLGIEDASHVVVVTSGLHGVEGPVGSVVQTEALKQQSHCSLPPGVGIMMIHAVNPWGFAHSRRVDSNNIDLNRNFIDKGVTFPATHPDYPVLDPLINPVGEAKRGDDLEFMLASLRKIMLARGTKRLAAAIAQGQYTYPKGLFFGGQSMSVCSHTLQDILSTVIDHTPSITHLDIHTGLGRPGKITLIGAETASGRRPMTAQPLAAHHVAAQPVTAEPVAAHHVAAKDASSMEARVQAHYGLRCIADTRPGNAYRARGTLAQWCTQQAQTTRYLYLCVEIGTVGPLKVLSALRRENRAYYYSAPHSRTRRQASQTLRETFIPPSARWCNNSVNAALDVFHESCQRPTHDVA